jgi:hypothetical protein
MSADPEGPVAPGLDRRDRSKAITWCLGKLLLGEPAKVFFWHFFALPDQGFTEIR